MDGERSNKGENDTTGYDFQLYTLLCCIEYLRKHKIRFPGFKIGSAIEGFGALDDVVLHGTLRNSETVTNLLQVKYSSTKMIDKSYLCDKPQTYVYKYFTTFLNLKWNKPNELRQVEQMIIWTNMQFHSSVQDWFEKYVPRDDEKDTLKPDGSLPYERFRFKEDKFKDISQSFLEDAHPRTTLIDKFVRALFNKQEWSSKSAAKSYYRIMAKEIIECDGDDSKFKENFITGNGLLSETVKFRKYFEAAMKAVFVMKKIGKFIMADVNSEEYKNYFKVKVDAGFKEGTNADVQWKKWEHEPQVTDLEEFRNRFVFYVKVPVLIDLEKFLKIKVICFNQLCEILKNCAFKKMIDEKTTDQLFSLMKHREGMDFGPYKNLQFDDLDVLQQKVIEYFKQRSETCLKVKPRAEYVYCTVSRLISLVKNCLAPLNDRYLVVNCNHFNKNWQNFQAILKNIVVVENGLKCIIIAEVPKSKSQEIETNLSKTEVKVILVGDQLDTDFVDEFDISTLHPRCKDIIKNQDIFLLSQQQMVKASDIFGNELFQKENYRLALDLFQRSMQLEGNELQLDEHFRERKVNVNQGQTNVLDLICRDDYQQIILSDHAGMGKSTEMINIAIEMRKTYKDHLVICLDCKDALRYHDEKKDIAHIVCKITSIRGKPKEAVVRKVIELGKMILLLDGIDEVSDSCRTNLEAMLKTISKTKLFKLVIATRPHRSALIQKILPLCIVCQLEPFSESDQLEYLMSFWKVNELDDNNDRTRIEENTKELIKKFRSMLKDGSLIGIPLQTYMIAVIYQTSIMSTDFEQPKPYKIGYIYKQFVALKFQELIKRQFDLTTKAHEDAIRTQKEKFNPDHITMAQKIYANAPVLELNQCCDRLQTYGLVRLHPTVGFVHFTYFEYFICLYFLTNATNVNREFVSFMRQNLCVSRDSIVTKFMDFHIDEIDPCKALETDNSITDCLPNDFEPPKTGRLHPDKLREFHLYLLNHCSESERYTLIRNSFNLSVFNVFEVLYDTLPKDTKSALKFCFGNKPEPYCINLKLLGGNQVLQLLSILLKKNPDNFVQLYLTKFGDDDEDFLEVACRKPFLQVLDWLVDDLIPNLNCEERNALNSYVDRRFDKYLQLVVKHNNAQFLQRAIQRAEHLWPKTAIKCFLLERNVLQVLLNTVELPSDTKPLKDEQRVEMVHHMHDLYQWAFEGQFKTSEDFRNTIANLRIDVIKSAFNVKFSNL